MLKTRQAALVKEETRAHSAPEVRSSLSFEVSFGDEKRAKSAKRVPPRLTAEKKQKSTSLIDYTDDETMLIAEIMRDAHIEEKKNKAGRVDMKIFDASRRRMCSNYLKEQCAEKKAEVTRSVPDVSERRRRVKEMAAASRKQVTAEPPPKT